MRYAIKVIALASTITTSWEALSMRITTPDTTKKDLDALATAQEAEAEALASLATANRTLRGARVKQRHVRQSLGYYPQQQGQHDQTHRRQDRKCVICSGPHWASRCPEKARSIWREHRKNNRTQRTANLSWLCIQKQPCSQGQHRNEERLRDIVVPPDLNGIL